MAIKITSMKLVRFCSPEFYNDGEDTTNPTELNKFLGREDSSLIATFEQLSDKQKSDVLRMYPTIEHAKFLYMQREFVVFELTNTSIKENNTVIGFSKSVSLDCSLDSSWFKDTGSKECYRCSNFLLCSAEAKEVSFLEALPCSVTTVDSQLENTARSLRSKFSVFAPTLDMKTIVGVSYKCDSGEALDYCTNTTQLTEERNAKGDLPVLCTFSWDAPALKHFGDLEADVLEDSEVKPAGDDFVACIHFAPYPVKFSEANSKKITGSPALNVDKFDSVSFWDAIELQLYLGRDKSQPLPIIMATTDVLIYPKAFLSPPYSENTDIPELKALSEYTINAPFLPEHISFGLHCLHQNTKFAWADMGASQESLNHALSLFATKAPLSEIISHAVPRRTSDLVVSTQNKYPNDMIISLQGVMSISSPLLNSHFMSIEALTIDYLRCRKREDVK